MKRMKEILSLSEQLKPSNMRILEIQKGQDQAMKDVELDRPMEVLDLCLLALSGAGMNL